MALQLAAQVRVGLHERAGDPVPERGGLSRYAAAVDLRDHVHAAVVAGGLERQARVLLERDAREVDVEGLAVDRIRALAWLEDHACDGALALAGGAVAGVGGELERSARGGRVFDRGGFLALGDSRVVVARGRRIRVWIGVLALGGPLLLEHEVRLEVRAGNDDGLILRLLVVLAPRRALAARLGLAALGGRGGGGLVGRGGGLPRGGGGGPARAGGGGRRRGAGRGRRVPRRRRGRGPRRTRRAARRRRQRAPRRRAPRRRAPRPRRRRERAPQRERTPRRPARPEQRSPRHQPPRLRRERAP